MLKRLTVSLRRDEAIRATRVALGQDRLVYVLIADKRLKYKIGKSRIAYIGTTAKGAARIAGSLAFRAKKILRLKGVRTLHARVVTCRGRQKVSTWKKLERAFLLRFRELFGEVPKCNVVGKKMKETDEFRYFRKSRVTDVIEGLR